MYIDSTFKIALLISLGIHSLILIATPHIKSPTFHKKIDKMEVLYIKPKIEIPLQKQLGQRENLLNKQPPQPFTIREDIFKQKQLEIKKGELTKINEALPQPKITLPPVTIEKSRNPTYLSYYQIIRERIKRCAYRNYLRQDAGDIYISFVISSDGNLQEVRLMEDKSSTNQYLRDISMKSIKEASPFPVFPKDLPYQQLSFNIIISYETE